MTRHFVVIGNPIAHSKSPDIHQSFAQQFGFDIRYAKQFCPDNKDSFNAVVGAFFNGGGVGANITVPFKQIAYELCTTQGKLSSHAVTAGAVNTLMIKEGQIYGDNTDGQGLVNHMLAMHWPLAHANIAIIGAGGAARGIIQPLIEAGVAFITVANRTLSKADTLITAMQDNQGHPQATLLSNSVESLIGHFDIIINATSIGLTDDHLPLAASLKCSYAYDMMYGRQLPFLRHFAALDAVTSDGYGMLLAQAALSFELWTGAKPNVFN